MRIQDVCVNRYEGARIFPKQVCLLNVLPFESKVTVPVGVKKT